MKPEAQGAISDADFQIICLNGMYETLRDFPSAFNVLPVIVHELPDKKYGYQCGSCGHVQELTDANFLSKCSACEQWHLVTTIAAEEVPPKTRRRKR